MGYRFMRMRHFLYSCAKTCKRSNVSLTITYHFLKGNNNIFNMHLLRNNKFDYKQFQKLHAVYACPQAENL